MKNLKMLIFSGLAILAVFASSASAQACRGGTKVLNKASGAVVLCYDQKLKGYLSRECFHKPKAGLSSAPGCEIREVILRNKYSPVKLSVRDLQNNDNPDASACTKLHQRLRILTDSEGVQETFCESRKDGSLAPLYLLRWRT